MKSRIYFIWQKIIRNSWVQHLAFWMFSFYVLISLFRLTDQIQKIDIIYTLMFHISIVSVTYINLKILIPNFLAKRKMFPFVIIGLISLIFWSYFNLYFFERYVDIIFPTYYFISYYEIADIIKFHLVYLFITSLLKLSKAWFVVADSERNMAILLKEKTEAELSSLKSQINPHFLFNSLNSIHALAMKSSEKTKDLVIQLSDMLRYMLYDTEVEYVSLNKEIEFINNYVSLQKVRVEDNVRIDLDIDGNTKDMEIAPLILLPLVENAFKHGLKGDINGTFIKINFIIRDSIIFEISNNKGKGEEIDKHSGGLGLQNVQKRLELIYPGRFELNINDEGSRFIVYLKIKN